MENVENKLKKIIQNWFYSKPLFFTVACGHSLVENPVLTVPLRCGKKRIEFSQLLLQNLETEILEHYLELEIYRILLGHPYARKPFDCKQSVLTIASDVTIYKLLSLEKNNFMNLLNLPSLEYLKNQAVRFHTLTHPLGLKWSKSDEEKFFQRNLHINNSTGFLEINDNLNFEQWYKKILFLIQQTAVAGENAGFSQEALKAFEQESELWEENEEIGDKVKSDMKEAEISESWGSVGGNIQRQLVDNCDFSFDYRRSLMKFRHNIVNSKRMLTRMKPSRRYGFSAMGSRYDSKANLLIAVDVSGSITDESIEHFYHCIKQFFFLKIIEKIDVIFFDVNVINKTPVELKRKMNLEEVRGKGGTNFQPVIDFFFEHKRNYDGLIFFTDGESDIPVIPKGCKDILWILDSRQAWEKSKRWINSLEKNSATYLSF